MSDARGEGEQKGATVMLNLIWLVALVCLGLWVFGLAASYTMGGLIHVLLVVAIVAIVVRLVLGRKA
jgi:uncharacterized protein DUF5670